MSSESSSAVVEPVVGKVPSLSRARPGVLRSRSVLFAQRDIAALALLVAVVSLSLLRIRTSPAVRSPEVTQPQGTVAPVPATGHHKRPEIRSRFFKWAPILISLLSLALAGAAFYTNVASPDVTMRLPDHVIVGVDYGSKDTFPYIYVQASFVSTGTSTQVEVITSIEVRLQRASDTAVHFQWFGLFQLRSDPNQPTVTHYDQYASPEPLVISHQLPQIALGKFTGPTNWRFQAGTYTVTVTASRLVNHTPLVGTLRVTIDQANADYLNRDNGVNGLQISATPVSSKE